MKVHGREVAYLAIHSLDGVLLYERDVEEHAKDREQGLNAVHVHGADALRKLAALCTEVAEKEEAKQRVG